MNFFKHMRWVLIVIGFSIFISANVLAQKISKYNPTKKTKQHLSIDRIIGLLDTLGKSHYYTGFTSLDTLSDNYLYYYFEQELKKQISNKSRAQSNGNKVRNELNKLQEELQNLKRSFKYLGKKNMLEGLEVKILKLPESLEQLNLFFEIKELKYKAKTETVNINVLLDSCYNKIEQLKNPIQKVESLICLGDFAKITFQTERSSYYLYEAKKFVNQIRGNNILKHKLHGKIENGLAELFFQLNSRYSLIIALKYLNEAGKSYANSGDFKEAYRIASIGLANETYLFTEYGGLYYRSSSEELYNDLLSLVVNSNSSSLGLTNEVRTALNWATSQIMLRNGKLESALKYAINGTVASLKTDDISIIETSLRNIGWVYSKMRNHTLAYAYNNMLNTSIASLGNISTNTSLNIRIGDIATNLGDYRSAVDLYKQAEKTLHDSSYGFSKFQYLQFKISLYKGLAYAYRKLWMPLDSAYYYDSKVLEAKTEYDEMVSSIYYHHQLDENEWLATLKNRIIQSEKKEKILAIKNQAITEAKRQTTDSLAKAYKIIAEQIEKTKKAIEQKALSDSIAYIANIKLQLQINKEQQNQIIFIIVGIGSLSASLIAYFIRKGSKEKKQKIAEYDRLNELSKNKIHNLQNDYSDFNRIVPASQTDMFKYFTKYGYYLVLLLANWKRDKISLWDEIVALKKYHLAKTVIFPDVDLKIVPNPSLDLTHIRFIPSIFDTLLDNSMRHGFEYKEGEKIITLTTTLQNGNVVCEFCDNGIPPSHISEYFGEESLGLKTVKKRLELYASIYGKKRSKLPFEITPLPNNAGTYVKIVFPYENI